VGRGGFIVVAALLVFTVSDAFAELRELYPQKEALG
jgi:hypothetical protein